MARGKFLIFLLIVDISVLFAQATLPLSNDFSRISNTDNWTVSSVFSNTTGYYFGNDNNPCAAKFSKTGDYIQVFFSDIPSTVSYFLAGNSFSGGKFSVLESADASSWDTLHNHTDLKSPYLQFTDSLNPVSRYVKFLYVLKVSGNVGLDDVFINKAENKPSQNMSLKYGLNSLKNGSELMIGNKSSIELTLQNINLKDTLNHVKVNFLGVDSADFSVSNLPDLIQVQNEQNFTLKFNPSVKAGTKKAKLILTSADSIQDPFIIYLVGINGLYASEPESQPDSLSFSNIKSYTFAVDFKKSPDLPSGYLVLKKTKSYVSEAPADGITYSKGDYIGQAQVAYLGSESSINITGIEANTDYYFAVFSYNDPKGFENYLQSNPLKGKVISGMTLIGNYYSGIFSDNNTLLSDLQNRIKAQAIKVKYDDYDSTIITNFASRDTVGGQKVITCVYSGFNYVYVPPFKWGYMSREHTFAHSWMPNEDLSMDYYSDLFNLFPADQEHANMLRSNYPLGEVEIIYSKYLDAKLGLDKAGNLVFEPRDQHKGDAARALFYMCLRYNGLNGLQWKLPPNNSSPYIIQDQSVLKKWHFQDLPDSWEKARNDYVFSIQKNRNPFIDSINYACKIDFKKMEYIEKPNESYCAVFQTSKIEEAVEQIRIDLYPNLDKRGIKIVVGLSKPQMLMYSIVDLFGNLVCESQFNFEQQALVLNFDESNLTQGIYFFSLKTDQGIKVKKFIIE